MITIRPPIWMNPTFATDNHPNRPRILFVGLGESSHTHSWIDLLADSELNVRLFALPTGEPAASWPVRTYVSAYEHSEMNSAMRTALHSRNRILRFATRSAARATGMDTQAMAVRWLGRIVSNWQPHIVHTLGLDSGNFYFEARNLLGLSSIGKWVLQTRGGSDLALTHLDPDLRDRIAGVMRACDIIISDNLENFRIARTLGVPEEKFSDISPVPGTGGIDLERFQESRKVQSSKRRTILWPKAYESPWSKALPVYEAIKLCWDSIKPCEIQMLALHDETRAWFWTLPEHIRRHCRTYDRVPRIQALQLMSEARVMLAPSLIDGIPNSMYEAMASAALPVVSPLETIRSVVKEERNVLFARNLYPHEIALALERAMTDDDLVESAAKENLELVMRVADRSEIRRRVLQFYEKLATSH